MRKASPVVVTTVRMEPRLYTRAKASKLKLAQLIEAGLDSLRPEPVGDVEIQDVESVIQEIGSDLASVVRLATENSP